MYFLQIAMAAAVTLMATPALACKCYVNGSQNNSKTQSCCAQLHGVFRYGNDCQASSISEHLSNFRSCCGGSSDCDYPKTAEAEAAEAAPAGQDGIFIKTIVVPASATATCA